MILTEEEAKTKLCHETLAAIPDAGGGTGFEPTVCIGSACMAWRWSNPTLISVEEIAALGKNKPDGFHSFRKTLSDPQGGVWIKYGHADAGYCGKAGKP